MRLKLRTVRAGDEWDQALEVARRRGDSLSDVIRRALRAYVRRSRNETR